MEEVKTLLGPLIGELVWCVRRGHGTFLTMEFGMPHLSVREPIVASPQSSAKVKRNLNRRRVDVTGDWHLWVQYGNWKVSTADGVLQSRDPSGSPLDECLADLNGQRLASVGPGSAANSWTLKFDLGGVLEIWPSNEIPDDQWSLYSWDGNIVSCRNDGSLAFEERRVHGQE